MAWPRSALRARDIPWTARRISSRGALRPSSVELHVAAHHEAHQSADFHILNLAAGDVTAIAQHGEAVADLLYLLQTMRDVYEAHSACALLANDRVQDIYLAAAQGRRRLVHDDQLRPLRDGTANFDHLLLGDAQIANFLPGIDVQAQACQQGARVAVHRVPIDEPEADGFTAEVQVLRDRHEGQQIELLVDRN